MINSRVHAVIVYSWSICVSICVSTVYVYLSTCMYHSVSTFSLELRLWWILNVDMWVCATGAWHSKSLEWRCQRTAFSRAAKYLSASFLLNRGCGGYKTWICG